MEEIICIPVNSEKAIHYIINPNFIGYEPIEDFIDQINIPITVLYGEKDWMYQKGSNRYL